MTQQQLRERLADGAVVSLATVEWEELRGGFEVVAEHDTRMRGMITVLQTGSGMAVVEEPSPSRRVVRAIPSEEALGAFVAERMATYERMWDGCGCRIDYDR